MSACGNGIVAGGEACDDGNTVDGDGWELDREVGWLTVAELPLPTMLPSDTSAAPPLSAP
ncbi:MAG TPA: DUF4215 domain-containing protein [Kofleriaceae bacterium]|nr:DUF4215 domain-containing protein [Kofleriaceae bacterium]